MKSKQDLKKLKLVFCLITLLSNACIYLLASESKSAKVRDEVFFREDHITIRIRAKLLVPLSTQIPVSLVSDHSVIKNVFILQEVQSSGVNIQDSLSETKDYFVDVHKSEFKKIIKADFFKIYPNDLPHIVTARTKGADYEVNY